MSTSPKYNALVQTKNPTNVIQYATTYNIRNASASVIEMANGNLLCAFHHFGVAVGDGNPSTIWACVSTNDGLTWGTPYEIIGVPVTVDSIAIPSLYKKDNGNIICICWTVVDQVSDCSEIWQFESTDNGAAFDAGSMIHNSDDYEATGDYYTIGSHRIFRTASGRLLYPFDVMTTPVHTSMGGVMVGRVLYSDDEGDSWNISATVISTGLEGTERCLAESCCCQLPNGNILRISRTVSGFARISTSTDDGLTWSNPPTKSGTLTTSNATIWISYTDGKLIAIANRKEPTDDGSSQPKNRIHLDLWLSEDNGTTWTMVKNIAYKDGLYGFNEPTIYARESDMLIFHTKVPLTGAWQDLWFTKIDYSDII